MITARWSGIGIDERITRRGREKERAKKIRAENYWSIYTEDWAYDIRTITSWTLPSYGGSALTFCAKTTVSLPGNRTTSFKTRNCII